MFENRLSQHEGKRNMKVLLMRLSGNATSRKHDFDNLSNFQEVCQHSLDVAHERTIQLVLLTA